MKNIYIYYPKAFNSQTKFDRKISRIIGSTSNISIFYPSDHNNLIGNFFNKNLPSIPLVECGPLPPVPDNMTHAIVFDDGECFSNQVREINDHAIPLRVIKIDITRVINIKRDADILNNIDSSKYEYIGRGSYWGNPHSMFEEGDERDEVIRKYKYDFDYEKFIKIEKKEVYKLAGKRLGCFCSPASCHGDILANHLNSWDDGK
jgi:hypothetical protein